MMMSEEEVGEEEVGEEVGEGGSAGGLRVDRWGENERRRDTTK
jgi:hypothetical protein